jgi:phenylacetaldehyde dehydrogenase
MGVFFNQGQICAAGTRVLVQRSIADQFAAMLAAAAGTVPSGAVAKKGQFERVNRYIRQGIAEGATLLAGGESTHSQGWFVKPTVFADASNGMSIARDEIFGPVATISPFDTEEKAITVLIA